MIGRRELLDYLDSYLDARTGGDFGPNGLQVEGADSVRKIATGVSACLDLFERARRSGADTILVHHGLFWEGAPRVLTGIQRQRVASLIHGGMNLIAYHLPLDRHPEVGNNAVAARGLKLVDLQVFGSYEGAPLGFHGRFASPLPLAELIMRCRNLYGQEPQHFGAGPDPVRSLGIISGGAQKEFQQAIAQGLDAYLTGEVSEWVMNVAQESRTHYFAAGHYATERLGIQALGGHLRQKFGLEVEFIDIPNPV